jgi:hypothetical protein
MGDEIDQIRDLLAADAIMYTDGGGVTAARKPIYGADQIARFMVGLQRKADYPDDPVFALVDVNGDPGVRRRRHPGDPLLHQPGTVPGRASQGGVDAGLREA